GQLRPDAPKMCSEFWSGWFDKWGARHETRPAKDMVEGMDEMLSKGISFSLYMTHGGTSFGHWAGANSPGFAPDVTSYDYDAPINEYGLTTPKYFELRKMMEKYNDGKKMPAIPKAPMPIITVPKFELKEFAPLVYGCGGLETGADVNDLTFEYANMGWGSMFYSIGLPEIPVPSVLSFEAHDYAQVFVNDTFIGKIDRVKNEKSITLPAVKKGDNLVILVEAMGRINFGRAIKDFKGIPSAVKIETTIDGHELSYTLKGWEKFCIPDDYDIAVNALNRYAGKEVDEYHPEYFQTEIKSWGNRGYYRGYFNLSKVGDTFLNFETWGKGQVYVNGHAMGRIWSIGPQQTLYVPGCWLKKGKNEVIVLDVVGPKETVVWGQAEPELNKLQLEMSNKHNNIGDKPDLNSDTPAAVGQFQSGNGWQTVKFQSPKKGRLFCLEALSTQSGDDVVAIAEIYALGSDGKRLSREPWTTKYADSENENGNHTGDKVYDLQESTYWQTVKGAGFPHLLVIDLGGEQTVSGFEYLPRAEQGAPGSVKNYKIYIK
ncbi:MAG: beta-galactosidase, partial [Bacteroidaceae bacterium]|nr:beta-galactosidase [Bacteroidaceae bacterium]